MSETKKETETKATKQPMFWNKWHPAVRIAVLIVGAIILEFIMIILGFFFSANSSSAIGVLIFALIVPVACIIGAIYILFRPRKDDEEDVSATAPAEEKSLDEIAVELTDQAHDDLIVEAGSLPGTEPRTANELEEE